MGSMGGPIGNGITFTNIGGHPYQVGTQAHFDAQHARSGAEGAAMWDAKREAELAKQSGLSANTSYTNPTTGVSYNFSTSPYYGRTGAGSDADPRYEDFDYYGALAKARSAQSGPLAPAELPAHVTGASPADAAAAQASEFGRAKDRIGKLGRGTLMSMQEGFQARGFGGSGMEASATQGLLSDLQGQEGEVIRDQAIQNLVRQRQVEDRNYAGDVNQRSQDIGFTTATRGQDATYELGRNQQLAPLMSLIAAHPRRLY